MDTLQLSSIKYLQAWIIAVNTSVLPMIAFAYDLETCRQIPKIKNLSNMEHTIVEVSSDISISHIEKQFNLSQASVIESANLYDIDNIKHEKCLLLPKNNGILKIVDRLSRLNELLISYGVTRKQFQSYNNIGNSLSETLHEKVIVYIPLIPSHEMERKFLFPIYGGRILRRFQDADVDPITAKMTVHNDIKILGKKSNKNIISIADGNVISAGYNEKENNEYTYNNTKDTIVIEHADGIKSYFTFSPLEMFVKVGEIVKKGDVLAHYTSDGHQHTLQLRIEKHNQLIDPMILFID